MRNSHNCSIQESQEGIIEIRKGNRVCYFFVLVSPSNEMLSFRISRRTVAILKVKDEVFFFKAKEQGRGIFETVED